MITKHTIYVLNCDECGRTYSQNDDDGYMTWFYSRKEVIDDVKYSDWVKDGKRFYCPDCWEKIKEMEGRE